VLRFVVCDDRRAIREGLTRALSAVSGVREIKCVAGADELVFQESWLRAALLLVGVRNGDSVGIEAVKRLTSVHPRVNVLAFGGTADATAAASAIAAGARGYLRWDDPARAGARNSSFDGVSEVGLPSPTGEKVQLSMRELQVLHGMTLGKTNAVIGRDLHLSEDTVKTHARRLFRRLGVHDRAEAVAHGIRRGFVT